MPGRLADGLFWIVAAFAVLCGFLFILVLSGRVATESANDAPEKIATIQTTETPEGTATVQAKPKATPAAAAPARRPAQATTTVVLTAARGDCWFQARAGSAQGRVLEERVLSLGESTTIASPRVWVALGAAGNLDVTVNGKPRQLPAGTLSLVLDAKA